MEFSRKHFHRNLRLTTSVDENAEFSCEENRFIYSLSFALRAEAIIGFLLVKFPANYDVRELKQNFLYYICSITQQSKDFRVDIQDVLSRRRRKRVLNITIKHLQKRKGFAQECRRRVFALNTVMFSPSRVHLVCKSC